MFKKKSQSENLLCLTVMSLFPVAEGMYGGRMPNYSKSQCSKEANLMPVPSPQQIQFPLLGKGHTRSLAKTIFRFV